VRGCEKYVKRKVVLVILMILQTFSILQLSIRATPVSQTTANEKRLKMLYLRYLTLISFLSSSYWRTSGGGWVIRRSSSHLYKHPPVTYSYL